MSLLRRATAGAIQALLSLTHDPGRHWSEYAACAESDPDLWYPAKGEKPEPAKLICRGCPVRTECLQDALATQDQHGVRGGLTPRERRKLRHDAGPVAA